jgi:hypothetical protein
MCLSTENSSLEILDEYEDSTKSSEYKRGRKKRKNKSQCVAPEARQPAEPLTDCDPGARRLYYDSVLEHYIGPHLACMLAISTSSPSQQALVARTPRGTCKQPGDMQHNCPER